MVATISSMKQHVLNMAMRGELVKQSSEDKTIDEYIIEDNKESDDLDNKKNTEKQNYLSNITEKEKPFDIPHEWKWVRLGSVTLNYDGQRRPISMKERVKRNGDYPYYGASGIIDTIDGWTHDGEYILIGEDGANLLSRSTPISFIVRGKIWVNNHAHVIKGSSVLDNKYLNFYINSISLEKYVSGTAQPKLNQKNLNNIILPLPPLSEQRRIVSKVEVLFEIIDKIAKRKEDTLKTIQRIRETTQQKAIRGKLVDQDENDKTASDLIKQINAEKKRLIKEKIIKKSKQLPDISKDSKPFEIPENWEWIRLGEVIELISGRDLKKSEYNDASSGIPYITGASNFSQSKVIVNRWTESPKVISQEGDLLITVKGTIGEMTIQSLAEAHIARQVMAIRNVYNLNTNYLQIFLQSRIIELKSKAKSMIPGISRDDLLNFEFPLPPINEQNRIVKKIESIEKILLEMEDRLI